ncbi:MAG: ABC transporter substrate-binding protein [Sphingobacteriales bacterium]|nr:ABC transporter substrate-binding protein [Sphingobacteriales bacterium]
MKIAAAGALAIAFGVASAAPTLAADKVSLRLNWLLSGVHSIFYLGVEKGFYEEAGIDLTIGEGQGSARTVQVVATGGDTFGLVDGGSVIAGASHGAPVKSVLGIMNTSPYGMSFRADSGVRTIKDVEGKTIAGTAGEASLALLPAIWKQNNVDESKVKDGAPFDKFLSSNIHEVLKVCAELRPSVDISVVPQRSGAPG